MEIVFAQPGLKLIVVVYQAGLFAGLVTVHNQLMSAPKLTVVLTIVPQGEGLQKSVLAVVIVDALDAVCHCVVPRDQTAIARMVVAWPTLHNDAGQIATRRIAQPLVGIFPELLSREVLIGELTTDKGPRFVDR